MTRLRTLDDLDVTNKRVLVRVDFNVPINDGLISNEARIKQALPTIVELLERDARVILMSHLGRPEGIKVSGLSLRQIKNNLRNLLPNRDVIFVSDVIGKVPERAANNLEPGQVLLLENLRYEPGEETNDPMFAAKLAALAEIYVNDAFSCSHRVHASVHAVAAFLPSAAGRLMEMEIGVLSQVLDNPQSPIGAIIGGSKVSTKLRVLKNLVTKVQYLVIGGAMANTFIYAQGNNVGKSFFEEGMKEVVDDILLNAKKNGCEVIIPSDVIVADVLEANTKTDNVVITEVPQNKMILDIGPTSRNNIRQLCKYCRTIIWNGPLGAFETQPFDAGTISVANYVADLTLNGDLISVIGGGDTVTAIETAGLGAEFTYVSMAGGAFLEWLEGKKLPGVGVLES